MLKMNEEKIGFAINLLAKFYDLTRALLLSSVILCVPKPTRVPACPEPR